MFYESNARLYFRAGNLSGTKFSFPCAIKKFYNERFIDLGFIAAALRFSEDFERFAISLLFAISCFYFFHRYLTTGKALIRKRAAPMGISSIVSVLLSTFTGLCGKVSVNPY